MNHELIEIARAIEGLKQECGMDPESPRAIQNSRYMTIANRVRALAAAPAQQAGAPLPLVPSDSVQDDLNAVYEAFHIGKKARSIGTLLINAQNAVRRSDCLSAIEHTFFMVPTEPEPEDFGVPGEDCLLNWGHDPAEYVETFREALATIAATPQQPTLPAKAEPVGLTDEHALFEAHCKKERVPQQLIRRVGDDYPCLPVCEMWKAWQARATLAGHPAAEPVEYQYRTRADWSQNWGDWTKCSEAAYLDYAKATVHNDWHYETRVLYASTTPEPVAAATQEPQP